MSDTVWDRLSAKTADALFIQELVTGFELAPRAARGILDVATSILGPNTDGVRTGQIRIVGTAASARHGRPIADLDKRSVIVTVDAGREDMAVLRDHGAADLRRVRILRVTDEAFEQDCLLTEEDLGRTLQVAARTIRRDIAALRHQGYMVRTRGYHHSIGRGQTHKVLIVEQYLKRHGLFEIARWAKHSLAAVQRYIQTFGRVIYLQQRQTSLAEIAFLVGIGEQTAQQYLDVYARYNQPEYQDRLAEMVAPPTNQPFLAIGKKGALR
jgi:hypothetical protein